MEKILYRANGSKNIGMGHLARGVLLSKYLLKHHEVQTFFLINDDLLSKIFLEKRQSEFQAIPEFINYHDEINYLQNRFKTTEFLFSVVDVLDFDLYQEYLNTFRKFSKNVVVITDDSNKREISADLIINGNPNQQKEFYDGSLRYLVGPSYFLMEEEFISHKLIQKNHQPKWLITLGGSDHNDLLFNLLGCLDRLENIPPLIIVTSTATGYLERLKNYISHLKLNCEVLVDTNGLFPLWSKVNFAITAGGNTLFERIASGTPGITLCQLNRQNEIACAFESLGVNFNLGYGPEISDDQLLKKLKKALDQGDKFAVQQSRCKEVVDGLGLKRICDEFISRGFINEL